MSDQELKVNIIAKSYKKVTFQYFAGTKVILRSPYNVNKSSKKFQSFYDLEKFVEKIYTKKNVIKSFAN